jgi:hypothetical protein
VPFGQSGFTGNRHLVPFGQSGFTGNSDIFQIIDQQTRSHLFLRLFKNIGTPNYLVEGKQPN